jgi:hypothetical protein
VHCVGLRTTVLGYNLKHAGVIFNVCLLDFYITQILTSMTVSIECISWLIKVIIYHNCFLRTSHVTKSIFFLVGDLLFPTCSSTSVCS